MVKSYVSKSKAYKVGNDIEEAMRKVEHLWEPQGFSKEDILFWNKIRNQLGVIIDKIARRYRKQ